MSAERLKKLRWRCRRGMRELDVLLEPWLREHGEHLDAQQLDTFADLLECTDMDLYTWFTGRGAPVDPALAALVERITSGR